MQISTQQIDRIVQQVLSNMQGAEAGMPGAAAPGIG